MTSTSGNHEAYICHLSDGAELQRAVPLDRSRLNDALEQLAASIKNSSEQPTEIIGRSSGSHRFVQKMHAILNNPDYHAYIAWLPKKDAWRVLDRKGLEEHVLLPNFRSCHFRSFMRQVNAWSFERVRNGPDQGAYFHQYFIRKDPDLSFKMLHPRMLRHLSKPNKKAPRRVPNDIATLRRGDTICTLPPLDLKQRAIALGLSTMNTVDTEELKAANCGTVQDTSVTATSV